MIREVTMYQAVCDGCGEESLLLYRSVQHAINCLSEDGWLIVNHETYCPDCVEYDEETDSYKPKEQNSYGRWSDEEPRELVLKPINEE